MIKTRQILVAGLGSLVFATYENSLTTAFLSNSARKDCSPKPVIGLKLRNNCSRPQSQLQVFGIHSPPNHYDIEKSTDVKETIVTLNKPKISVSSFPSSTHILEKSVHDWLDTSMRPPSAFAADDMNPSPSPPSNEEVNLLRTALGTVYAEKNPTKAEPLLSKAITAWERQNPDERAALYRVRATVYMDLNRPGEAIQDYTKTIQLLKSPGGELADPTELPSAYIGRARAIRSSINPQSKPSLSKEEATMSANDYESYLKLTARDDDIDDDEDEKTAEAERIRDGAARNPYATWEWGAALRSMGDYKGAYQARLLATDSFNAIGDRPRSVISELDGAIDLTMLASSSSSLPTSSTSNENAKEALEIAIAKTTQVSSRDVPLLQRVIAKEGEARMALASTLWDMPKEKGAAEAQFGELCLRLEQLDADDQQRAIDKNKQAASKKQPLPKEPISTLKFSIDDTLGAGGINCSKLKNEQFLTNVLGWPTSLESKAMAFHTLEKQ